MIWREKRILLIILALLLAANTMFFFTYRVQYQSRLDTLDERLAQVESDLEQARTARIRAEQTLQSYRKVENDVLEVFNEHWATQPERFTKLFGEVTRLAMASSLVPSSYSFKRGEAKRISAGGPRQNLGATEVSITFGVEGTYDQVRRLINLLELSRQFVIIERINLSASDAQVLSLSLQLKTIFRDERPNVATNRL
jgi:type II secretory pathway pseudopilin PulG